VTSDESASQAPASLVFVGSGELEGALREQARALGLRVVDRTGWGAEEHEKSGHSRVCEPQAKPKIGRCGDQTAEGKLTRINADYGEKPRAV
jgi:hypothetical protein